jgi:hypothetical protein
MKTKTIQLFEFDELSDAAKEKAREWYREGNLDYKWWDSTFDDAKAAGKYIGIDVDDIRFSGFWSQGDGASFAGSYEYRKGGEKALKADFATDKALHAIAKGLTAVQRRYFYQLGARVTFTSWPHYCHERCTSIDVWDKRGFDTDLADAEETVSELLRDFMRWIYRRLEAEYEWLQADEQVDESIRCNGYTFDEAGNRED